MNVCFAVSWIKTDGLCRYPDGQSKLIAQKKGNVDACKTFCVNTKNCDAFDDGGGQCWLYHDSPKQKRGNHIGNGNSKGVTCYQRAGKTWMIMPHQCSVVRSVSYKGFRACSHPTLWCRWFTTAYCAQPRVKLNDRCSVRFVFKRAFQCFLVPRALNSRNECERFAVIKKCPDTASTGSYLKSGVTTFVKDAGECEKACSDPPTGFYYTSHGGTKDACPTAKCTNAKVGEKYTGFDRDSNTCVVSTKEG